MTTIQDWKKSDMYGSHLNEFEHDFQSNRKNKNRKKQQEEYNRYETTSRKLHHVSYITLQKYEVLLDNFYLFSSSYRI